MQTPNWPKCQWDGRTHRSHGPVAEAALLWHGWPGRHPAAGAQGTIGPGWLSPDSRKPQGSTASRQPQWLSAVRQRQLFSCQSRSTVLACPALPGTHSLPPFLLQGGGPAGNRDVEEGLGVIWADETIVDFGYFDFIVAEKWLFSTALPQHPACPWFLLSGPVESSRAW